jgi:EAL and modified HD-GYP domain-containing signal transduction protein
MEILSPSQISVGRQPIYDFARNIIAYEVLSRKDSAATTAEFDDGDAATARLLVNILTEIGVEQTCGVKPLFLNCTRYFLDHEPILPPRRCVLEILENLRVDQGLVDAVALQRRRGYKIALDDFVYSEEWKPLLRMADYVKIDVRQHSSAELKRAVKHLPGFSGILLAEKIESQQELNFCRELGFTLFQGYYLRKPETLVGHGAPNNLVGLISLSQQLLNQDVNADDLAESIQGDVGLTYRLLRLANSAMIGSRTRINSVRHAVSIAGTDLLARWVALMGLLRIENSPGDYVEVALHRARACELLSLRENVGRPEQAYFLGLLSLLDGMLNSPWEALLPLIPLNAEIADGLSCHQGDLGRLLTAVECYEAFTESGADLPDAVSSFASLPQAFWEGAAYARKMVRSLQGGQVKHT